MAEIPLFPLPLVLLPGGRLALKIFETRYIDMVRNCLRENVGFGLILIKEGDQVLRGANQALPMVEHCGSYCTIVDFDQSPNGLLEITLEAQIKFSVRDQYETPERLMMAKVEFLPEESELEVPTQQQHLVDVLHTLMRHPAVKALNINFDPQLARDVSGRLTELLPGNGAFKQRMLTLKDPLIRLDELEKQIQRLEEG